MAKRLGLGDNFYLHGIDLSGTTGQMNTVRGGPAAIDVTPIDKSGMVRLGGIRDGEISFTSFFDDGGAANRAAGAGSPFVALSALPTTDVHAMYCRGTALGDPAACMVAKQVNLDPSRGADGSLTMACQCLANAYGLEWGKLLTAGKRTDTAATNGTSVDDSASSAFGLQAYLQVFDFSGTDVTVKIQESSDNGAGDAFADVVGGAFTQITTEGFGERIATATNLTVERYLRAVTVTTGGVTTVTFAVAVVRNAAAPVF